MENGNKLLNTIMHFLEMCSGTAEKIGIALAAASGFVMLYSLLVGVFTRIGSTPAIWTEEIARMCMLWLTTNGASVAFNRSEMVRFNLITDILPKKVQYFFEAVSYICIMVVLIVCLKYGYEMLVLKSKVIAAASGISYMWWALGLYIGFILMTVHNIKFLVGHLFRYKKEA